MDGGTQEQPGAGGEAGLVRAVLAGYREGAFPMAIGEPARVAWYESDPRGVIRLDGGWRVPRRLMRTVRGGRFVVTADRAFERVMLACGDPRRDGGWINGEIVAMFGALHRAGLAHSVEAWVGAGDASPRELVVDGRVLVGGVYGLCVGGVFCAESMFSRPDLGGRDASKVCLVRLAEHLISRGFGVMDTQMWSEHLAQFGCEEVGREEYLDLLGAWRDEDCAWGEFA